MSLIVTYKDGDFLYTTDQAIITAEAGILKSAVLVTNEQEIAILDNVLIRGYDIENIVVDYNYLNAWFMKITLASNTAVFDDSNIILYKPEMHDTAGQVTYVGDQVISYDATVLDSYANTGTIFSEYGVLYKPYMSTTIGVTDETLIVLEINKETDLVSQSSVFTYSSSSLAQTGTITPSVNIISHTYNLEGGTAATLLDGAHVGQRLLVNEVYEGIVISNTPTTIVINAVDDFRPEINAIWRLETTDNIGRYSLCLATQVAVSDWPSYPVINISSDSYDEVYHKSIDFYPDGTDLFAVRLDTQISEEIILRHSFPAWVEHLHVQTNGQYRLGDNAALETTMPYKAYYVSPWPYWQDGREVTIYKEAVEKQDYSTSYISNSDLVYSIKNIAGKLDSLSKDSVNYTTDRIFIASDNTTPVYISVFDSMKYYPLLSVVISNGSKYIKTAMEVYRGEYNDTWVYDVNNIVLMPNGTYGIFDGTEFILYQSSLSNFTQAIDRGYYDSNDSYAIYDIVIDKVTDYVYITLTIPTGLPGVDASWYKLCSLDTYAAVLCSISFIEIAAPPTSVELTASVLDRIAVRKEFLCTGGIVLKTSNVSLNNCTNLYFPDTVVFSDYRSLIYGVRLTKVIAPTITVKAASSNNATPVVTTEIQLERSSTPRKTETTVLFKRGNKVNLPASAAVGEPLVTLDTHELFIGTGTGLRKISDVIISETTPEVIDRDKLWYNPITKRTSVYKDNTWQTSVSQTSIDYGEF
jgi:hypothetical protein